MGILGAVVFVFVLVSVFGVFESPFDSAIDCLFALRPMSQQDRIPPTK